MEEEQLQDVLKIDQVDSHSANKGAHRVTPTQKGLIGFCGARGIPANYGGFETVIEEISKRFVQRGYDCEVFCRRSSYDEERQSFDGRKLRFVNGSKVRKLDTFVSAIQTGWHIWRHKKDYSFIFWHNNANLPGVLMTLMVGIPMAINTNGLEWRREKWSRAFKLYYYISTYLIAKFCKSLISDSIEIRNFYKDRFNATSHYIPYGVHPPASITDERAKEILDSFGLKEGHFFTQVTRIEPDNLPYEAGVAFQKSGLAEQGYKMVIVGYKDRHPYSRKLKSLDGKQGVVVVDATYDLDVLAALRTRCASYVHGNHAGGTNPALLEAMVSCPRIMAIDINFSREVLGETAIYFDDSSFSETFHEVLRLEDRSKMMRERIADYYCWDETAESYMRLAEGLPANYSLRQEL